MIEFIQLYYSGIVCIRIQIKTIPLVLVEYIQPGTQRGSTSSFHCVIVIKNALKKLPQKKWILRSAPVKVVIKGACSWKNVGPLTRLKVLQKEFSAQKARKKTKN